MNRNDILDRVLYSHYLEKLYATLTGRLDKILSILIIIFGSSVIFEGNPYFFGILIVIMTSVKTICLFGEKSGASRKKAFSYQRLYTNESSYSDDDLKFQMLELESSDECIPTCLESIAMLKTEIQLGVKNQSELQKIPLSLRALRLLCG